MSHSDILQAMPGLRRSELELTLSVSERRGRPPKQPTIQSLAAVKRWRATQRPRTIRAALECIDFLLSRIETLNSKGADEQSARGRTLPGFS
jgi:hypothetical protein